MKTIFLWKLTENYLNAIMVVVTVVLAINAVVYGDGFSLILIIIWILSVPFIGTFIDMKSNQRK